MCLRVAKGAEHVALVNNLFVGPGTLASMHRSSPAETVKLQAVSSRIRKDSTIRLRANSPLVGRAGFRGGESGWRRTAAARVRARGLQLPA